MEKFDLVIVGGGPAGAILAQKCAAGGYRTLVLERRDMSRMSPGAKSEKCCGGLLSERAQKALAANGIGLPTSVLGGDQIFAVRAVDLQTFRECRYVKHYLNMNRELFDRYLMEQALNAGAECRMKCDYLSHSGHILRYRSANQEYSVEFDYLIAADGAASRVRRQCGATPPKADIYVAIQAEYAITGTSSPHEHAAFFDPEITDFYGWRIPKNDRILLGLALPNNGSAKQKFQLFQEKLRCAGWEFGPLLAMNGSLVLRPRQSKTLFYGQNDHIFAIGEAAGWISPSSAEGFSFAIRSAEYLYSLLQSGQLTLQNYRRQTRSLRLELCKGHVKSIAQFAPKVRNLLMCSQLTAIKPLIPASGKKI